MTEEIYTRIHSIVDEISQHKYNTPSILNCITPTIVNQDDFYKDIMEIVKILPYIYKSAKITKSNIRKNGVTKEGKHITELMMQKTGYNIMLPDGTKKYNPIFNNIGYVSRELFVIAMVYTGFNYVVRDGEIYFLAKHNTKIDKIRKITHIIDILNRDGGYNDGLLKNINNYYRNTQSSGYRSDIKKINNTKLKVKKLLGKIKKILNS